MTQSPGPPGHEPLPHVERPPLPRRSHLHRPDGPRRSLAATLTLTLLVFALVIGTFWALATGGHERLQRWRKGPIATTVSVSLTPDATGTLVDLIQESPGEELPPSLQVSLPRVDPVTGAELHYSDVKDVFGEAQDATEIRASTFRKVRTDGRHLQLTFHLESLNGHRIVFPVPTTSDVTTARVRLYVQEGRVSCQSFRNGNGTPEDCGLTASNVIEKVGPATIRLELLP